MWAVYRVRRVRLLHWLLIGVLLFTSLPAPSYAATLLGRLKDESVRAQQQDPALPPPLPTYQPPADPQLPSLSLEMATPDLAVLPGETFALTLTLRNQSPWAANDLLLTLPLPPDIQFEPKQSQDAWTITKLPTPTTTIT